MENSNSAIKITIYLITKLLMNSHLDLHAFIPILKLL